MRSINSTRGKPNNYPLVTIVTVTFNAQETIEATIKSVLNQSYPNIEYIVIDGGSSDDTVKIIEKFKGNVDYCISEKDEGIYDAMNKGLAKANGIWINFMNSGDTFYTSDTVLRLFKEEYTDIDIIYGSVQMNYPNFNRIIKPGNPCNLWQGMQFCHQSTFVLTEHHKSNKFNVNNKIAADLEFFYSAQRTGLHFQLTESVVSSVTTGGVSETNQLETILAWRDAVCETGCNCNHRWYYVKLYAVTFLKQIAKAILPKTLIQKMIEMKK